MAGRSSRNDMRRSCGLHCGCTNCLAGANLSIPHYPFCRSAVLPLSFPPLSVLPFCRSAVILSAVIRFSPLQENLYFSKYRFMQKVSTPAIARFADSYYKPARHDSPVPIPLSFDPLSLPHSPLFVIRYPFTALPEDPNYPRCFTHWMHSNRPWSGRYQ